MNSLPDEIIQLILLELDTKSLLVFFETCKVVYKLKTNIFWDYYVEKYFLKFKHLKPDPNPLGSDLSLTDPGC